MVQTEAYNCRNPEDFHNLLVSLDRTFSKPDNRIKTVINLSRKIKAGIESIDPFIQRATGSVCPQCKNICCVSKHGYYSYEDLVYLHAVGGAVPVMEFGRQDTDPCHFLTESGCSLQRRFRPSGCNWYFCDALFDFMEPDPLYREFDDNLREVAELWMKMMEEFKIYICQNP